MRVAWAARSVVPVVCRETVTELLRVLAYPKFRLTRDKTDILLAQYLPFCETVALPPVWPTLPAICRDRDEAVFIALLQSAVADALVSGDADLTELRDAIAVISVIELRETLDGGQSTHA